MKRATLSSALLSKAIIVMVFVALSCVSSMYSQAPVISSFTPIAGCAGSSITIVGTNMLGVTSVTIGGTPVASITSDSSSQITAVAASGSYPGGQAQVKSMGSTPAREKEGTGKGERRKG